MSITDRLCRSGAVPSPRSHEECPQMKSNLTRIALFSLLLALSTPLAALAESKTFIKEYSYQASEDDSRNSSRVIALREVKRLLLEELGTYLESETEVKNFQLTRDQITTLTAGIVQTEILEEKWDGRLYWLKSKITADSDKVVQSIDAMRKDREKTRELETMRQKSDELLREVERLRKEMASANDGNRPLQKAAYDKSVKELSAAEWIEKGHAVSSRDDEFKGAFEAYSRAIELDPDNSKAYYFRARISEKNQALADYYKILSIAPKDSESHLLRAWTYKELEKSDLAFEEFAKAIEKAAGSKEKAAAYHDRGRYYLLFRPRPFVAPTSRDIPDALERSIRDFSRAIALDPLEASYYSARANSYMGTGQHELSLADLNRAIEMDPKSAGLYSSRAHVYRLLKKPELAVADFSRAIEMDPESFFVSHDYMLRAITYEDLGKFALAIRDWSKLIELRPQEAHNYRTRAGLYGKVGRYEAALKDYSQAIALNPREGAETYYGRALLYASRGDSRKSIQDLRNAIQLDPGYKARARSEAGFGALRQDPDFIRLIGP